MGRRIVEASLGLILILLALMTGFQEPLFALIVGLAGLALLWHQHQLGKATRHIRRSPAERARPDDARWAQHNNRRVWEQRVGEAIRDSVRVASKHGLEAGFDELGRHIERAVTPGQSASRGEPAPFSFDEPPAAPKKSRRRRAQVVELGSDEAYAHAVDAARAAGLELSRTAVIPVDVGLIVYNPAGERSIHRTTPVDMDAAFVQPFVQLNMPTRAVGRLRYEIIDSDGQALFIHEDNQALERGVNLLTPAARLRAHSGMARSGDWRLLVSADGVRLIDHHFVWQEDARARLRRHLYDDGELTREARLVLEEEISGPSMSLDDLLGAQDDSAARAARM
jgi:hypothetical protein